MSAPRPPHGSPGRLDAGRGVLLAAALLVTALLATAWLWASGGPARGEVNLLRESYRQAAREGLAENAVVAASGVFIGPRAVLTSAHVLSGCAAYSVESPLFGYAMARPDYINGDRDIAVLVTQQASDQFAALSPFRPELRLGVHGYRADDPGDALPQSYEAKLAPGAGDAILMLDLPRPLPHGLSGGPVSEREGAVVGVLSGRLTRDARRAFASPVHAADPDIARYAGGVPASRQVANAVVKVRCTR
ncbi:serine protease [Ancylobacter mangrovi]|uniref:serine protease n=1 Tax=Ancylobacter mangrovi TaxID=2972472 RepID=UPI002163E114|nr:serine protease [Ancylobacter mangrovi]MCS0502193.1 serine protease [Ancylobacter mangrovi]